MRRCRKATDLPCPPQPAGEFQSGEIVDLLVAEDKLHVIVTRLDGDHRPCCADQVGAQSSEESDIGADIDERISGSKRLPNISRDVLFVPAGGALIGGTRMDRAGAACSYATYK